MSVGIIQATRILLFAQADKMLADALRAAVKRSLGALVAALAGSRKAEVAPLVSVELYLEATHRIELRPSAQVGKTFLYTTDNPRSVCLCAQARQAIAAL